MKNFLTVFLFFIFCSSVTASEVDSLIHQLNYQKGNKQYQLYAEITEQFQQIDNISLANNYAQKWLTTSIKNRNPKEQAKALVSLAEINIYSSSSTALDYAKNAASVSRRHKLVEQQIKSLNILGQLNFPGNLDLCKKYMLEALSVYKDVDMEYDKSITLNILGLVHLYQSDYQQALDYLSESLQLKRQLAKKNQEAILLNSIGVIYRKWGEFKTAIEYYQQALEINEELNDKLNIARVLSNIGNIYYDYGIDHEKALEYYNRGLNLFKELKDSTQVADSYNNIAHVYKEQENYTAASNFIQQSLSLSRKIGYQHGIATSLQNLMELNLVNEDFQGAIANLEEANAIYKKTGDKLNSAIVYFDLGKLYNQMELYQRAQFNLNKGLELAKELNIKNEILKFYEQLSDVHEKLRDHRESLHYYKQYSALKDSVFREDYLHEISELQTKYETEKKVKEIKLQRAEIERKDLEVKRGRTIIYSVTMGFILILVFSILLYRQYKEKQKANVLLQTQNEEIKAQRDKIFEQTQQITASIRYARKIQKAILPPQQLFHEALPEHFIMFRPRDIVSGDFYWITQRNNKTVIAAADCTGHGVPGAFMSMLGIAFLNEIVNNSEELSAAEILNQLRENVVDALHQNGKENDNREGMDIALCVIDSDAQKMQFAGAFNPLYLMRDGKLKVFKGDKMPISIYQDENDPFKNHEINLKKNDVIYIFSDGYADQFGNESRKKFMVRKFKDLLVNVHKLPMNEQKKQLDKTFDDWKGDYDQVDDVLVMGIRF